MKVERSAAFEVEVEWGLLPWLCDVASEVMDVLFGLGVSTQTLIDNGLWGAIVFEGANWLKVPCMRACKILGGGNVTNLLCVRL